MKVEILGLKIDQITLNEVLNKISSYLNSNISHIITTINPEYALFAQKDLEFKNFINEADIATCDGVGLSWAGKILKGEKLSRATGSDLVKNLLEMSEAKNPLVAQAKFFLLGGAEGVAQKVAEKYSGAKIVGAQSGGKVKNLNNQWKLDDNDLIIQEINDSGANILIVTFGMKKQEMWIKQNLPLMPNIRVAMGVGGTFDFLSGKIKRAPNWMKKLGLEWLFRLICEPKRIGRIYNAVVKFGFLVLKEKL